MHVLIENPEGDEGVYEGKLRGSFNSKGECFFYDEGRKVEMDMVDHNRLQYICNRINAWVTAVGMDQGQALLSGVALEAHRSIRGVYELADGRYVNFLHGRIDDMIIKNSELCE